MAEDKKMSEDKLQWMYKGISGLVDRDEYLLGRKVDKTFELLEQEEQQSKGDFNVNESDFSSTLFTKNTLSTNTVTVDLNAKVREDPLYEIRKKQVEERKKIIENPMKMKRIKQMLEAALKEEGRSSDSDSDHERRRRDHRHDRDNRKYRRVSPHNRSRHESRHSRDKRSDYRRSHRSRSNERRKRESPSKDERRRHKPETYTSKSSKPTKTKMSEEELERKRNEMLQNASWREEQRKKNVESYKEEETKEESTEKGKSAAFLKPMINSVLETDSVEKRVKQKLFTTQREHNAMSKSFARR